MIKCTDEKKQIYFVQIKVKDPVSGKWRAIRKCNIQGKRNAQAEERKLKSEADSVKTSSTFRSIWKLWEKSTQASKETIRHHTEHFEKRFDKFLDMPIDRITKAQLVEWRSDLAGAALATATKNITIQYVCSVFRFVSETYGVPNTAVVLKPFKLTDEELMSEMSVWTPEEYSEFRKHVDNPLYLFYFDTLFWTGLRRGEAIALQKTDLQDGWLNVHASQRTSTEGLKPTKTKQRRSVRIDQHLENELRSLLEEPGPYLFGGETPLSPTAIDYYFKKAIKKSGVKRIRLHDLRHSHATWLINSGVNIVAVSRRLGHASIEQTLKTYTHLLKETENQLITVIETYKKQSPF